MGNTDRLEAEDIILQNLSEASDALERKKLIYDAQIKELVYLFVNSACEDSYGDFEIVADRLRRASREFFETRDVKNASSLDFRVSFCALASEEILRRGVNMPSFKAFDEVFGGPIRIACFSNAASNEAYGEFEKRIAGAEQVMCESIAAACEEVYDGRCELCLLPVYSSADGFMQNVYRHTVRYGLAPAMSVDMPSDRDFFVRYFLFSANPCARDGADALSLTVVPDGEADVAYLSAALSSYGALLEDVHSLAHVLYEGDKAFNFTFNVKNADIVKIMLFLQINFPRFEINGIYEKIERQKRI